MYRGRVLDIMDAADGGRRKERRARALVAAGCLVILFACSPETRFVAVEPADADVRVVAAVGSNNNLRSIKALTRDEPFPVALNELFDGDGRLNVYVFRYDLASLTRAFPGLAGRDAAAVAAALNPAFGETAAGRYAAPSTMDSKILSAIVSSESDAEISYTPVDFDQMIAGGGVVFQLGSEIACPPGQGALRVFNRDDVGRVCIMQRTDTCEWEDERACAYFEELFGDPPGTVLTVREQPPNLLILGAPTDACTEVQDAKKGESRTFECRLDAGATTRVSIQNTARGRNNLPWQPELKTLPALQGPKPVMSRGAAGAVYAVARSNFLELRRLAPKDENSINDSALQVLTMPSNPDNIYVSNAGEAQAISADSSGNHVTVSAEQAVAVTERDFERVPDIPNFYTEPVLVPEAELPAARRRGAVISGPGQTLYALVDTGIAVLQPQPNTVRQTAITGGDDGVMLAPADNAKIAAVRNRNNQDRIVVWTQSGALYVFDNTADVVVPRCELGEVLAAIDGPRVFRRPNAARPFVLELIDLAAIENGGACNAAGETYFVPPNDENAQNLRLEMDSLTYATDGVHETINYRYGTSGGVLDLRSGLSQAAKFDTTPATSVIFPALGDNKNWVLFAPANSQDLRGFLLPVLDGP